MTIFSQQNPEDFQDPTQLPANSEQSAQWQQANRSWWESHPMRYDWNDDLGAPEFSKPFYEEIDKRFFATAREYMPWKKVPFDPLIDFESLKDKDVLEIGVGNGSHAGLISQYARSFTGIDLTDYAVKSTSERMRVFGRKADIRRMDAEKMEFPDGSFDFIWSWGVIHHSSNTAQILKEMHRVLRPGGRAVVMIYHRSFWSYYFRGGLVNGLLRGKLFKSGSIHKVNQHITDGAMARFYKGGEWRKFVSPYFTCERISVCGNKGEAIPLPGSKFKSALLRLTPNVLTRIFLNSLRQGVFLVAEMKRKD